MSIHKHTIGTNEYWSYLYVFESLQGESPEKLQAILDSVGNLGTFEGTDLVAVAAWTESGLLHAAWRKTDPVDNTNVWARWSEWYPTDSEMRERNDAPPIVLDWPAPATSPF